MGQSMLVYRGKFLNSPTSSDVVAVSCLVEYRNIMDWEDNIESMSYHYYRMDKEIFDLLEPFQYKVVLTDDAQLIEIDGDINELILLALRWDPSWGERCHDTH